jgi:hypothetical protein
VFGDLEQFEVKLALDAVRPGVLGGWEEWWRRGRRSGSGRCMRVATFLVWSKLEPWRLAVLLKRVMAVCLVMVRIAVEKGWPARGWVFGRGRT